MQEQRTRPTAVDLAVLHDAQSFILRQHMGGVSHEEAIKHSHDPLTEDSFRDNVHEYERKMGTPTPEELEVFLSFSNLVDLGPAGGFRAFAMLMGGIYLNQIEAAKIMGFDEQEARDRYTSVYSREHLEEERAKYDAQQGGLVQALADVLSGEFPRVPDLDEDEK